jgi:DNA-binding transcriptional regulator YiaG
LPHHFAMSPAENAPNPIGAEIRRLRDSLGMTLQDFGRHVEIPWQTIQAYEGGRAVPPATRLLLIMHATRRAKEPFRVAPVARAVALAA